MGNRAVIHFHDGDDISPGIYLHWGGEGVRKTLEKTKELMGDRKYDVDYTAARCVGICHNETIGALSLGIWNAPKEKYSEAREKMLEGSYSQGDAGVFLVDCRTWEVEMFGGYGFNTHKTTARL